MIIDILFRIYADPIEYIGARSLERLSAFELGYGRPPGANDFQVEDPLREWIIGIYQPTFGVGAMDAFWILRRISPNDQIAFELFFRHLEAVLAANSEILKNPKLIEASGSKPPPHLSCYLEMLEKRPGIYLPCATVGCLRAFLDGRRLALLDNRHFECADLDGFEHWIRKKLDLKGLFRWENVILQHFVGDDKRAFTWCLQELKAYRASIGPPSDRKFEISFHTEENPQPPGSG